MSESVRATVQKVLDGVPEDASLEDVIYELYVLSRIEQGLADIEAARTVSHEDVRKEHEEWRRSVGL